MQQVRSTDMYVDDTLNYSVRVTPNINQINDKTTQFIIIKRVTKS